MGAIAGCLCSQRAAGLAQELHWAVGDKCWLAILINSMGSQLLKREANCNWNIRVASIILQCTTHVSNLLSDRTVFICTAMS